jgi:Icc-related predicted phosphoesterase
MYHAHAEVMRGFFAPYSDRIVYLENEFAELEGIKFWGSPVQPEFCGWAWNEERGEEIRKTWAQIPNDIDVLVTHGPPMGILDWVGRTHVGCEELRLAIHRAQPKVHVFGHIHGAYGKRGIRYPETVYPGFYKATQFYNAAIVSDAYKLDPKHKPWVLDYDGTTFTEVTDAV